MAGIIRISPGNGAVEAWGRYQSPSCPDGQQHVLHSNG
ncbi:hypothetical protein QF049_003411 [Paenibacillus sp. W4I10]|nr:hypothetical protein [Paenibacillus sp. W4I10]